MVTVLIVFFSTWYGASTSTAEFATPSACEAAGRHAATAATRTNRTVDWSCSPKGDGPAAPQAR